jgi:hypothetical protein
MTAPDQIARIMGPALVAVSSSEAINIDIFTRNSPAVVYLNGTLLFIAGVAIVQARGYRPRHWSSMVALVGWLLVFGGLYRMFAPEASQFHGGLSTDGILIALFAIGGFLTFKAYGRA